MRSPARQKATAKQQIASIVSTPAPVNGWNDYDSLAAMKETFAVKLDNVYPNQTDVELRGGCESYATGMTGNGKTLATYNGLDGTSEMYCLTSFGVYDVSSTGGVSASVASRTNGKHQWTNFGDGTNNYLILCNGVDKPLYYDGTTWLAVDGATSPALTGITTTGLVSPIVFKGRLMFIESGSLSFWYLAVGAAGGALTEFKLDGVAQQGGYLMAGASWSIDAGDGIDDRLAFITSKGEVIVYQGTDPSSASTWAMIGNYKISEPLGRNCIFKHTSDLYFITKQGIFSLTSILTSGGNDKNTSISKNIGQAFNTSAYYYGSVYGWKAVYYPNKNAVIVNIPLAEDGVHYQYVVNILTGAWCRFIGWDAEDFVYYGNDLYFCSGTAVYRAWVNTSDNGSNIEGIIKPAFSYFSGKGIQKHFKLFRGVFNADGDLNYKISLDTDFADTPIEGAISPSALSGDVWDTATWDTAVWSAGKSIRKDWLTPSAFPGFSATATIKTQTNNIAYNLISIDYVVETGNGI